MKRKIIKIDEKKCNGCGLCAEACAEGAIKIIDGKAKLIKDEYCDGLGVCIGKCPENAIEIIEREARSFDEIATKEHLNKIKDGKEHSCPSSKPKKWKPSVSEPPMKTHQPSALSNWPVQLKLVPVTADYFNGADILLSADCVPFADADFHQTLLRKKKLIIGCPKLDDADFYIEKLTQIIKSGSFSN